MTQGNNEIQRGMSFFLHHLRDYLELLKKDPEKAYKIYGFTLINSINPVDRAYYKIKYDFEPQDAVDFYNRGVHRLADNKYKEALKFFEKAIKMNPRFPEALYNTAWTYEKIGDIKKALDYWEEYLDFVEEDDEAELIEKHIEELQAS